MSDEIQSEAGPDGVRRRSLVRIGATAGWAVPVVAMAAPASAATCSGGTTSLTAIKVGDHQQSGSPKLTVTQDVEMCNNGDSATCDLSATATAARRIDQAQRLSA